MSAIRRSVAVHSVHVQVMALCLLIATGFVFAGGGQSQPAKAQPKSYSLSEAAAATAYSNIDPSLALPRNFPFQMLYAGDTFQVRTGTMLYVPVVYSAEADSALWPFPDVTDPAAVAAYYFDPEQLGAEFVQVVVDGKVSELGPAYAVGAVTPALPAGNGDSYTVIATFLTPLSKGTHTVTIAARLSGAFVAMHPELFPGGVFEFETTYTVVVE